MLTFKHFLKEDVLPKLPWDGSPTIGWWRDNNPIRLYHGTNIAYLDSFAQNGLNRPDPTTGMFSFALEPYTARAYAVMGGEARFLSAKKKAKSLVVPENQRAVVVFEVPRDWIFKHEDPDLGGNTGDHKERLTNKEKYDAFDDDDQQYYQFCELRVNAPVPAKYIVGYMLKG